MESNKYVLAAEGVRGNSYSHTSVRQPARVKVVTVGVGARSSGTVATVSVIQSIVVSRVTGLLTSVAKENDKYIVSASWNASDAAGFRYYEVAFRGETTNTNATAITFPVEETGEFPLSVTVVTYYGRSAATEAHVVIEEETEKPNEGEGQEGGSA